MGRKPRWIADHHDLCERSREGKLLVLCISRFKADSCRINANLPVEITWRQLIVIATMDASDEKPFDEDGGVPRNGWDQHTLCLCLYGIPLRRDRGLNGTRRPGGRLRFVMLLPKDRARFLRFVGHLTHNMRGLIHTILFDRRLWHR